MDISPTLERLKLREALLPLNIVKMIDVEDKVCLVLEISEEILMGDCVDDLIICCEDLLPYILALLADASSSPEQILRAYGRILPFAPYIAASALAYLKKDFVRKGLWDSKQQERSTVLLALIRLLHFDHDHFSFLINLERLYDLRQDNDVGVRYLAARLLCLYLRAADKMTHDIADVWREKEEANGVWEGRQISYRFLAFWEEQRTRSIRHEMKSQKRIVSAMSLRDIRCGLEREGVVTLAGVLLSTTSRNLSDWSTQAFNPETLIHTVTTDSNIRALAGALKTTHPILVSGFAGSGKTLLVRHVAQRLGKLDSMITLHLNEQTDAKTLIGLYSSGSTPGSFVWQAGVLTKAVTKGRWILIEDLDRAPGEVLSTLLPLIERRELSLPGKDQSLRASPGFRIFATSRTSRDTQGKIYNPASSILGIRRWKKVDIDPLPMDELSTVITGLLPQIHRHMDSMLTAFRELQNIQSDKAHFASGQLNTMRPITQREMLAWAARVSSLVGKHETITREQEDQIFLAAVDCFVGFLPFCETFELYTECLARNLGIDPQRRDFLLYDRTVPHERDEHHVKCGAYRFERRIKARNLSARAQMYSINRHTSRQLERLAAAVQNKEPLLLIGETGTGKTTTIQYLADSLGKRLVPFNLSQQSESGDLLGGFKPVNSRTIMIPLQNDFVHLWESSFTSSMLAANSDFADLLQQCISKQQWLRVCKCWKKAITMFEDYYQQRVSVSGVRNHVASENPRPAKKRKLCSEDLIQRWRHFAVEVNNVEARLQSNPESGMAFAFVEGSVVKAARDGDWILLDEINLAGADTLELLADLFDKSPSLMLTEAGSVRRIVAHSEFRVFAAMNPATDVGKKDLPPGIRSRFTELFVESPDRDLQSLQQIVQTYLGPNDVALNEAISRLHQEILSLSAQNLLIDGSAQRPHFSLRTLTRVLLFARDISLQCSMRRALYEGCCMSYLTLLDDESSQRVQAILDKHLYGKHQAQKLELKQPLRLPSTSPNDHYIREGRYWLKRGALEPQDQSHYIVTDFVRRNLDNLIRASMTKRFPILLQGPTSSGKTSMVEYLAKKSGHKFLRINNHDQTDLQEYLGSYVSGPDGKLVFQEGLIVQALRNGHWIVLDELNLAPTDVLEALNRLLDDNRELLIPETQEIVRPHPDFMLFATQNPAGVYGGRKQLSRAFRNRFLELHFGDIPIDELHIILEQRAQIPPKWSRLIVNVYKELSLVRQEGNMFDKKGVATLRDLFRWALRPADTKQILAEHGFMLLAERCRKQEERQIVKEIIEKVMSSPGPKVALNENEIYDKLAGSLPTSSVVWTNAMKRLYSLTSTAISNNEPVLLVGETGSGKTTVCQVISQILNIPLNIVNAHQNTETGDLIGAQRPARNRVALEAKLIQQLQSYPNGDVQAVLETNGIEAALEIIDGIDANTTNGHTSSLSAIAETRKDLKVLFEWADGSLVEAMKQGHCFLLDEIALAEDSVLERLNSVLEPQRSILLAEKGSVDSFVTAAESFQFFATMNPEGDYGKKELSPALRNRFTEIWVPALTDKNDIIQVVDARLQYPDLTQAMVEFAMWFHRCYVDPTSFAVHIRDLLAWADYVNLSRQNEDLITNFIHGAAMAYVDRMGANPAGMIAIDSRSVINERNQCLAKLAEILHIGATDVSTRLKTGHTRLNADRVVNQIFKPADRILMSDNVPTIHENAIRIARAMELPKPILIEGPPGVGKTTLVSNLADVLGHSLTRINLSEQTDLMDLFGTDVPVEDESMAKFAWRDGSFLRAMKTGGWVLLDEMNLAQQPILEGLNACLDHRGEVYIPELNQTFYRHPEFRLFATQNPHHQGGGRKGLPSSFVNRFTVVYADELKEEDIFAICNNDPSSIDEQELTKLIRFISTLSSQIDTTSLGTSGRPWEFNLRDTKRWLTLHKSQQANQNSTNYKLFLNTVILQRFRTDIDRSIVYNLFNSMIPLADCDYSDMYFNISAQRFQTGKAILNRHPLYSPMTTRLYEEYDITRHHDTMEALMIAVQENWPALLIGPTGCGKTTVIEQLAKAVGANVQVFSLNAEIDSMELVGGYEQNDPTKSMREFALELQRFLSHLMTREAVRRKCPTPAVELWEVSLKLCKLIKPSVKKVDAVVLKNNLMQLRKSIDDEALVKDCDLLLTQLQGLLTTDASTLSAKFQWIDGILVRALERGDWLVLDNANLCNPAALDRLNSLLEPGGVLEINEHSHEDGRSYNIKPHPDFRIFLTMDPKYGELSRALRNRCLELYMLPALNNKDSTDAFHIYDSGLARLNPLRHSHHLRHQMVDSSMASVIIDNLHFDDVKKFPALLQELQRGLFSFDSTSLSKFTQTAQTLGQAYKGHNVAAFEVLAGPWQDLSTMHPLNNIRPYVISPHVSNFPYQELNHCATVYELAIVTQIMRNTLDGARDGIRPGKQLTRLQKSIQSSIPRGSNVFLEAIYDILVNVATQFCQNSNSLQSQINEPDIDYLQRVWWDVYNLSTNQRLPESAISIIYQHVMQDPTMKDNNAEFAVTCRNAIELLNVEATVSNAASSTILYDLFKTTTATNAEVYEYMVKLNNLTTTFDELIWRNTISVSQRAKLRESIEKTVTFASTRQQVDMEALELVQDLIAELRTNASATELIPHFVSSFQTVSRLINLAGSAILSSELKLLSCQAIQPYDLPAQAAIIALNSISGCVNQLKQPLSNDLFSKLHNAHSIPIFRLDLLKQEIKVLGKTIGQNADHLSGNPVSRLKTVVKGLVAGIFHVFCHSADKDLQFPAKRLLDRLHGSDVAMSDITRQDMPQLTNIGSILESFFSPIVVQLSTVSDAQQLQNDLDPSFAHAWVSLFLGCINLYASYPVYDPVYSALLLRDLHISHVEKSRTDLAALREFFITIFACQTNTRIRRAEAKFASLEASIPPETTSWRSPDVRLDDLSSIVKTLLDSTVPQSTDGVTVQKHVSNIISSTQIRSNLRKIRVRIDRGFREIEDLIRPLCNFLDCLDIGFDLYEIATQEVNKKRALMVPFAGGSANNILHRLSADNPSMLVGISGITNIEYMSLVKTLLPMNFKKMNGYDVVHQIYYRIYEQWKSRLDEEQVETAAKSSLYKYRGGAPIEDENDEHEFDSLFPQFDDGESRNPQSDDSKTNFQSQAFKLCGLLNSILLEDKSRIQKDSCISFLDTFIRSKHHDMSYNDFLPALLQQLGQAAKDLTNQTARKSQNVYRDANIEEVQKMAAVVEDVRIRFEQIKMAWPEHATLDDVIRTCDELRNFAHTDPLMKIITKLEKLHEFVHEWQVVASKEFSANSQYDSIVNVIVSWRQLELSTWSRMLDEEAAKCNQAAQSWFFIAYESIVGVAVTFEGSEMALNDHTVELLATLESFFLSTGLGQFQARLDILRSLKQYLSICNVTDNFALRNVASALGNFISHMSRFTGPVEAEIVKSRAILDRNMKEIVQLASWKDRNILSLKQSAKKTHHALFKVIRKFRVMLNRPVAPIIQAGINNSNPITSIVIHGDHATTQMTISRPSIPTDALEHMPGWSELPARFKNINATVKVMKSLIKVPEGSELMANDLSSWLQDTQSTAELLRKATPSLLMEDNKSTVQHLKTRKRILLADTLKAVRQMGFTTNVGTNLLEKQSSLAKVLSQMSSKDGNEHLSTIDASLYQILFNMSQAREVAKQHHVDLTLKEVNRSTNLLESMLHEILRHRSTIVNSMERSEELRDTIKQSTCLVQTTGLELTDFDREHEDAQLIDTLSSLTHMLQGASTLIYTHSELAEEDGSSITKKTDDMINSLHSLKAEWDRRDNILNYYKSPEGISLNLRTIEAISKVATELRQMILMKPSLKPVLEQVCLWTDIIDFGKPRLVKVQDGPVGLQTVRDHLCKVVDYTLAAIESMAKTLDTPAMTLEDPNWLVKQISIFSTALHGQHIADVPGHFAKMLNDLHLLITPLELNQAMLFLQSILPIMTTYSDIYNTLLERLTKLHMALCNTLVMLSKIFVRLCKDGFCSPDEKDTNSDDNKDAKAESGTGLGDAEDGANQEDISKDIGEDEDLTELAMEKNKKDQDGDEQDSEVEDEKDAVDMAGQEMEGEVGSVGGEDEEQDEKDKGDDDQDDNDGDVESEAGSVDDLGQNTIDEKMWDDGGQDEAEKDQVGDKDMGTKDEDDLAAAKEEKKKDQQVDGEKEEEGGEDEEMGADEVENENDDENSAKQPAETADPHMKEQDNLDLPDDMELELDKKDGVDDEDRADDLDMLDEDDVNDAGISDTEEQAEDQEDQDEGAANEGLDQDEQNDNANDAEMDENDPTKTDEAGKETDEEVEQENETNLLQDNKPDDNPSADQIAPSEAQGTGLDDQQDDATEQQDESSNGQAQRDQGQQQDEAPENKSAAPMGQGQEQNETRDQSTSVQKDIPLQSEKDKQDEPFRKLGDALEKWYRQAKQIQEAQEQQESQEKSVDDENVEMKDVEFEHLQDENTIADTQALGAAKEDEAKALDETAGVSVNDQERKDQFMDSDDDTGEDEVNDETDNKRHDDKMQERNVDDVDMTDSSDIERAAKESMLEHDPKAFVGQREISPPPTLGERSPSPPPSTSVLPLLPSPSATTSALSIQEAREIFSQHLSSTLTPSLQLQEQLRLILLPTSTSKLSGAYRTGKRLSLKRIIPYIASNFKRDKIFLRRSAPSKREYHILFAIDDSKSMLESAVDSSAFDTLAMIGRALSSLEIGKIAVVGFGKDVSTPLSFSDSSSSTFGVEKGSQVVQQLRFNQTSTDVVKLLIHTKEMFETAATRSHSSISSTAQIWKLMLIIGDGVFEQNDKVRVLERELRELGIMVIFVIVDPTTSTSQDKSNAVKKQSIMDLQVASFTKDSTDPDGKRMVLETKRYLETFPFRYYLIVRDVKELPNVLAGALRKWFAEVAESK